MTDKVLQRTWAEIDLDAVRDNYEYIRSQLHDGCRVMAVVKANAYGHGVEGVARVYDEAGVEWFAVSNLEEALQLRRMGLTQRILILSYTPPQEAARLAAHNITTAVVSMEHARALNEQAAEAGVTLTVHVKLDTGMTRVGLSDAEEVAAVCRLPHLRAEGIFTHFAEADAPDEAYTRQQFDRFCRTIDAVEAQGFHFALRHCCNSAATMRFPDMHLDLVRPGIILYGCAPDSWMRGMWPLKHAMSLKTTVSQVKTVPPHTGVSYGRTYTTAADCRIATVPIGYADGYPRLVSNRAEMAVSGRRVPVIGRVCMDQVMLDVTALPDVAAGTVVTVFGEGLPVEKLAEWEQTIPYETLCLVGKRVPRVFLRGGDVIGTHNDIV